MDPVDAWFADHTELSSLQRLSVRTAVFRGQAVDDGSLRPVARQLAAELTQAGDVSGRGPGLAGPGGGWRRRTGGLRRDLADQRAVLPRFEPGCLRGVRAQHGAPSSQTAAAPAGAGPAVQHLTGTWLADEQQRYPGCRRLSGHPALVAQRIEHLTTDQKVGGSSPSERARRNPSSASIITSCPARPLVPFARRSDASDCPSRWRLIEEQVPRSGRHVAQRRGRRTRSRVVVWMLACPAAVDCSPDSMVSVASAPQ